MVTLDAIVIADPAPIGGLVCGLTLVERARRLATRAGAARVVVVDGPSARAALLAWWADPAHAEAVLVLRAGDQLVHTPLVAPLLEAVADGADAALAVVPEAPRAPDLAPGEFAGALLVVHGATAAVAQLAAGAALPDVAAGLPGAVRVPHGEIARHPVRTPAERAAAERLLYRILIKPQDNVITRYLYRPVSLPLTRLLVKTPITPNQVSLLVAVIVAIGIWLSASGSMRSVFAGTVIILVGSYLDCCDGEIARVKLLSSKFGAWLDTVVDELSSLGYLIAIGYHCHLYFGPHVFDAFGWPGATANPWRWFTTIGAASYVIAFYAIYWNIIVMVGSANSQDYVGRFEPVPGAEPGTTRLVPATVAPRATPCRPLPTPLRQLVAFAPNIPRRDFIAWLSVLLTAVGLSQIVFGLLAVGGVVTCTIVTLDHVRVRRQRAAIVRGGQTLVA